LEPEVLEDAARDERVGDQGDELAPSAAVLAVQHVGQLEMVLQIYRGSAEPLA
jgi:hypothetical protein